MIKKNNKTVGFIYKNNQNIDKVYKGTDLVFEQGYTREQTGVPPITTTYQAIGKNLKDYKIYGNSIQGKLPSEYQQVEYIESTGTQYIDTGFIPTFNTKISADFKSNKVSGEPFTSLFGTQKSTDNGRFYCLFGTTNNVQINIPSSMAGYIGLNNDGTYASGVGTFFSSNRTNYIMDISNKIIQIENKTWNLSSYYTDYVSPDYNLFILTRNSSGIADKNCSKGLLYSVKIWDDNTLIRNFIPCYRKSDNVIGMYDLVTNTFFTNAGTGVFLKGSNAPTPSNPVEIESVGDLITDTNDINYGKYKIPIIAKSKNLFDDTTLSNKWVNVSGSVVDSPQTNCKRFECVEGETYTLSASYETKHANNIIVMAFYNSNDTLIIRNVVSNLEYEELIATAPQNSKYLYAGYYTIEPQTIQLEKSDIATEYEPYVEPVITNIYLDEPLRKIGDYSDYIDFKNQKEFRNVIVNDDTGTQTIENSYTGTTDSSGTSITLPNIPTIKGTTIFEIDTEIQPSSMYIKYKSK